MGGLEITWNFLMLTTQIENLIILVMYDIL